MAGHSHWKQIKIKKKESDQKRGRIFSKLLTAIRLAARLEPNPQFNPRLRAAIEKAKELQVPQENIEKAIKKSETDQNLEDLIMEAYGPGGSALIINAITDNKQRTLAEIKHLLKENGGKLAEPGSVRWLFDYDLNKNEWRPKFLQSLNEEDRQKLQNLLEILENHDDIQKVFTNSQSL